MGKDLQILEAQLPFLKTLLQWEHHLFMPLDQEEAPQALVLVRPAMGELHSFTLHDTALQYTNILYNTIHTTLHYTKIQSPQPAV